MVTLSRVARLRHVLARRQPSLTVCVDGVKKAHNLGAIARSAEAAGCLDVFAVAQDPKHVLLSNGNDIGKRKKARAQNATKNDPAMESIDIDGDKNDSENVGWDVSNVGGPLRRVKNKELLSTSKGAHLWLQMSVHDQVDSAVKAIKARGMQIVTADLVPESVDFREIDYTKPTCILVGAEAQGVSEEARRAADHIITIPMVGMVQSLNVSAATAVVLYEAQRQREIAGMYDPARSALSEDEQNDLLVRFFQPDIAAFCDKRGIPYPLLDEHGAVIEDDAWLASIRSQ